MSTLPPQQTLPADDFNANKSASLDRNRAAGKDDTSKKKHSMFGGLFKSKDKSKKKDKDSK